MHQNDCLHKENDNSSSSLSFFKQNIFEFPFEKGFFWPK